MNTPLFFSIITPAYNEGKYLRQTLEHLRDLEYPQDRFEVIVVENGSTDNTLAIAKEFEGGNVSVFKSDKGVSRARNKGIAQARLDADWLIFLDADTLLKKDFLTELDAFLRPKMHAITVGTTALLPYPDSRYARAWFKFYDWGHLITRTSMSLFMVRRSLFPPLSFDESLMIAEDLRVIAKAMQFGKFFFMPTTNVSTSTRRFEKVGWWMLLFSWTIGAILPKSMQEKISYDAPR